MNFSADGELNTQHLPPRQIRPCTVHSAEVVLGGAAVVSSGFSGGVGATGRIRYRIGFGTPLWLRKSFRSKGFFGVEYPIFFSSF